MTLKQTKNRRASKFKEEPIVLAKDKRSSKRLAARHASFYIRDNVDIPQRDDDYKFMVRNVSQ